MAYQPPISQILSESQLRAISQVGTMKNMIDTPFFKNFKIKKGDSISLFDYLIMIARSLGIDLQVLLTSFLNSFFRAEVLTEFILRAIAQLSAYGKINLDTTSKFEPPQNRDMTDKEKSELSDINFNWLVSNTIINQALYSLVNFLKTILIQEIIILIFGKPKKESVAFGANGLTYNEQRLKSLTDEAVCSASVFSLSNPYTERNTDLEYNRMKKMQKIEKGELSFEVTCEDVTISLPDDPSYLFKNPSITPQQGGFLSPQDAMSNVFDFVGNQTKKTMRGNNSESNSKATSISFVKFFVETVVISIPCLLNPIFVGNKYDDEPDWKGAVSGDSLDIFRNGILSFISLRNTNAQKGGLESKFVPYSSCDIQKLNKNSLNEEDKEKTKLTSILCNMALSMLLGIIFPIIMKKLNSVIGQFIGRERTERQQRKLQKIKARFEISPSGRLQKKIEKKEKKIKLLIDMQPIVSGNKNVVI